MKKMQQLFRSYFSVTKPRIDHNGHFRKQHVTVFHFSSCLKLKVLGVACNEERTAISKVKKRFLTMMSLRRGRPRLIFLRGVYLRRKRKQIASRNWIQYAQNCHVSTPEACNIRPAVPIYVARYRLHSLLT